MMIVFYIASLLVFVYAVCIYYCYKVWTQKPADDTLALTQFSNSSVRVSIVIAARNEEKNIGHCLRSLLSQDYPRAYVQIIVVDDHSTDATLEVTQSFTDQRILVIQLREEKVYSSGLIGSFKKKALELGISRASGELILTTDADCVAPGTWLSTMVGCYLTKRAQLLVAPVKIAHRATVLSTFESLDFMVMQGITGAAVYRNKLSMCNGANLAYGRNAFYAVDGFTGIDRQPSGDDMLLMYKIFKKFPRQIFFVKSRQATVTTQGSKNWPQFFSQRIRWASKAAYFQDKRLFWALLLVLLLNLSLLVMAVGACWGLRWLEAFALLLLLKTIAEWPLVLEMADFFEQKKIVRYFFVLQPLHIIYIVAVGLMGRFLGYEWKGRQVHKRGQRLA